MSKCNTIYKPYLNPQSLFDRYYACWANNHSGWSKMKRLNRKKANASGGAETHIGADGLWRMIGRCYQPCQLTWKNLVSHRV